ncbi:hypothetical protein M413DRAFT_26327 [Hebeloma cylindrosporum]|uniref:Aminoglycoside phosphotransferase domain-containing protein n=1 Tax=Hebeloma cylindrosporum TaxID=76867 RepID=A0A0C3CHT1_HEBCY|nr:hypothetical protein M413DRAFT_26327 [Hebeloma cylindrosporum h7]
MNAIFDAHRLNEYTEDELWNFYNESPSIITVRTEANAKFLCDGLVAKSVGADHHLDALHDEVAAMELAQAIGINVPVIRRVLDISSQDSGLIIMDRIRGKNLEELWPSIGFFKTIYYAFQLRNIVRRMRAVTSQAGGGISSGRFFSLIFDYCAFPPMRYCTPVNLAKYTEHWLVSYPPRFSPPRPDIAATLYPVRPHVFTHNDLVPRNIMIDEDGKLWVVDWRFSGYYPRCMERNMMENIKMPCLNGNSWGARWLGFLYGVFRRIAGGSLLKDAMAYNRIADRSSRYILFKAPFSEVEDEA